MRSVSPPARNAAGPGSFWRNKRMGSATDESAEAVERIREALRGLRFGAVTAIVHDGAVVQVERTEKLRLPKGEPR